jgi:hypothetical protein
MPRREAKAQRNRLEAEAERSREESLFRLAALVPFRQEGAQGAGEEAEYRRQRGLTWLTFQAESRRRVHRPREWRGRRARCC